MTENGREYSLGIGSGQCVVVGVADSGRLDLDQHFPEAGAFQIDGFNGQGGAGFPGDGCFGFHGARAVRSGDGRTISFAADAKVLLAGFALADAWQAGVAGDGRGYTVQHLPLCEALLELSSRHVGSARVLEVHGRLDHARAKAFESALAPHLDACVPGGSPLVLDFSQVDYISSVGLRVLLLAAKQVKAQQGHIVVAALTPIVTEVFQVSHFNLVLQVFPDVAAAVAMVAPA